MDADCARRIYDIAMFTYLFAFFHFGSELLIFRSARFAPANLSPVVVSSESRRPICVLPAAGTAIPRALTYRSLSQRRL